MQFDTDEEVNKKIDALETSERPHLLQDGNTRLNIYKLEIFEILLYFIFKKKLSLVYIEINMCGWGL